MMKLYRVHVTKPVLIMADNELHAIKCAEQYADDHVSRHSDQDAYTHTVQELSSGYGTIGVYSPRFSGEFITHYHELCAKAKKAIPWVKQESKPMEEPIKFNLSGEMRGLILSVVNDAIERGLLNMPKAD